MQKDLEMRIIELENELKELRAARRPVDVTADDLKSYIKVKEALRIIDCFDCGGGGGCIVVCQRCIFECTCGPCNCGPCITSGSFGRRRRRFGGLGE